MTSNIRSKQSLGQAISWANKIQGEQEVGDQSIGGHNARQARGRWDLHWASNKKESKFKGKQCLGVKNIRRTSPRACNGYEGLIRGEQVQG